MLLITSYVVSLIYNFDMYIFKPIFNFDDQNHYLLALSDYKKPDQDTAMESGQSYLLFLCI